MLVYMTEEEKVSELEIFHSEMTVLKNRFGETDGNWQYITPKDLKNEEMKFWNNYKHLAKSFKGELNLKNFNYDEEEQFLRALSQSIAAVIEAIPAVEKESSKDFFYQWLRARFGEMTGNLTFIFEHPTKSSAVEEIRNEMNQFGLV